MEKIIVPIVLPKPKRKLTNACHELYRYLNPLGTFIGESLIAAHLYGDKPLVSSQVQPALYYWFDKLVNLKDDPPKPIPSPNISIDSEALNTQIRDLPRSLFHTAITQLVAAYEGLIKTIAYDIYKYNPHLLSVNDKQLTSEEIIQLGKYERIIESLTDKAVTNLVSQSYPSLVERFNRIFHVGIHDKNSPATLFDIHHLIEKRNTIVHNHGWASTIYTERMSIHAGNPILAEGEEVPIDFKKFYDDLYLISRLGEYIDSGVQKKWKIHTYTYDENAT